MCLSVVRERAFEYDNPMYTTTTRNVTVTVVPTYLAHESSPERSRYVFAYHVRIENGSQDTLQLLTRHWIITDAAGRRQEVRGDGVIGQQPVLKPGESFEYTSGTPLDTSSGIMAGTYAMQRTDGSMFDVDVPAFSLDAPSATRRLN